MKTNRIYTALISFSLVIFMSTTGISNESYNSKAENLEKSGNMAVNAAASNSSISEFSYLRFDVNDYTVESDANELPVDAYDYLRFDVSAYTESAVTEIIELPVANEFEYLRFDVNEYNESTGSEITDLPVANEFEYLRFDVNAFANPGNSSIEELLATE